MPVKGLPSAEPARAWTRGAACERGLRGAACERGLAGGVGFREALGLLKKDQEMWTGLQCRLDHEEVCGQRGAV